jgi:3-phenylpropionate/trans-cinnamate dioxygenase ferredoxin subunit
VEIIQRLGRRVHVCAVADLADGEAVRIPREETGTADAIAVFNDRGRLYALNDTCPHATASLSEGWVQDGIVECPWHNSLFCLRTGAALSPPAGASTVAHAIEIHAGEIWLVP